MHTYQGIHYLHERRLARRLLHCPIDRLLLRWIDEDICLAKSDWVLAFGEEIAIRDHLSVIYNGFDYARFEYSGADARHTGWRNGPVIVGTVGRLHKQKGLDHLLEVAALVHQAYPMLQLRIIADGPLRKSLESRPRTLGVSGILEFLGAWNDLPAQLNQFDLFALPALRAGLP